MKKKFQNDQIPKLDWLDRLTFLEIERITQQEKVKSEHMYLTIEFPKIKIDNSEHIVVYFEKGAEDSCQLSFIENEIVTISDPEMKLENLVENKHHKLSRSVRSGISDRDLKPNSSIRDQLNSIVNYAPIRPLTNDEQDLLWKYRFYLTNQKKALTKFLKCVKWEITAEANQAIDLLRTWQPMDIEDALELLSTQFNNPTVRRYAVARLQTAPDEVCYF